MAPRRFRHEDEEILSAAMYGDRYTRRDSNGRYMPSEEYLQIELLVDIRNLLWELNTNFAKIAIPIMVAQDAALEKTDNSKLKGNKT